MHYFLKTQMMIFDFRRAKVKKMRLRDNLIGEAPNLQIALFWIFFFQNLMPLFCLKPNSTSGTKVKKAIFSQTYYNSVNILFNPAAIT